MTNLPKLKTKYGEGVGIELFFEFPDLNQNEFTFLDSDKTSAVSSLSANGTNFSVGQYILLGNQGVEKTEIIKIHASTPPNSTTITLASSTVYAHTRGTKVTFIPYNQIVPERSTDGGTNFSALSAIDIRPDSLQTYLQRSSDASTDVYRFRFYNSADGTYSAYSDQATASGYADNTVHSIKRRALDSLGEKKEGKITDIFLNDALNEARRELDQDPRVRRWSFRTKFNTDIGDVVAGRWSISSPSDLRDRNTNKNILSLRIGKSNRQLTYVDKVRFNDFYLNSAHSTLSSQVTSGSTSIVLTASGDFDESGTVYIAAEDVTGTVDNATYTANTESTNTLSGVASISATHASGRDVWQNINFGDPSCYTIDNAVIYFSTPFEDDLAGENIYADYYQTLQAVNSDADTLDEPFYDLFVSFLRWKIKYLKSNGTLNKEQDGDYKEWTEGKERVIAQETTGQFINLIPVGSDDYYE